MDISLLLAPLEQLWHSPACFLIIFPISICAAVWETLEATPSKYIPIVCLVLGSVLYPSLTSVSTVPPGFPHPTVVLVLNGFVLGFIAFILHKFLIKKLIEKFNPSQVENKAAAQAVKDAPAIVVPPATIIVTPPVVPPTPAPDPKIP